MRATKPAVLGRLSVVFGLSAFSAFSAFSTFSAFFAFFAFFAAACSSDPASSSADAGLDAQAADVDRNDDAATPDALLERDAGADPSDSGDAAMDGASAPDASPLDASPLDAYIRDTGVAACPTFAAASAAGTIEAPELTEASGLAASRANDGVIWSHNDSGDDARLFALGTDGRHLGIYSVSGANATDWEDIAVGPGPTGGLEYIYVADIGDNNADRASIVVYRIPEPQVSSTQMPANFSVSGAERLRATYPGGPKDAEALLVDPITGDIFIATKADSGLAEIFVYPTPHDPNMTASLVYATDILFGAPPLPASEVRVTAGDISAAGDMIVLRTKSNAYLWRRALAPTPAGPIVDAFTTAPCSIPLAVEPQGEAITFAPDGLGYYTASEDQNGNQPLSFYLRQ